MLAPFTDLDTSDVMHMKRAFVHDRLCPECGDQLPSVYDQVGLIYACPSPSDTRQLLSTIVTPQDTKTFLCVRCTGCQVDYCCGCLSDWNSCIREQHHPTFPASDVPCSLGCAIGVFEILDALDAACPATCLSLRAEHLPPSLQASCELLARVLYHPFQGGDRVHGSVGVLLAASRLPTLLVRLFSRAADVRLWIERAPLYRAALGVLWRILGAPTVLGALVKLPRVLRTCGVRAWIAEEGEISWTISKDGSGGMAQLVEVLADRRHELERQMKQSDAETKKVLALLVGDIITVEKQAQHASL